MNRTVQRIIKRRWGILACLLLMALAYLFWPRPAHIRVYAVLPLASPQFATNSAGMLYRETINRFAFRDWQGTVRWRATAVSPSFTGWDRKFIERSRASGEFGHIAVLSNSNRCLGMLTLVDSALRVQTWQNGKLSSDCSIPISPAELQAAGGKYVYLQTVMNLQVTDTGRVFVVMRNRTTLHLYAIEQSRVIAQGSAPLRPVITRNGSCISFPHIVANGMVLMLGFRNYQYFTLALKGRRIIASRVVTIPGAKQLEARLIYGDFMQPLDPADETLFDSAQEPAGILANTGQNVVWVMSGRLRVQNHPSVVHYLAGLIPYGFDRYTLEIIRKPERRVLAYCSWPDTIGYRGRTYYTNGAYCVGLSPDGHQLAMILPNDGANRTCLMLRW